MRRLLSGAEIRAVAAQVKADEAAVRDCWLIIERSLVASYLQDSDDLGEVLAFLRGETKYSDIGINDLSFEIEGDRATVSLLDDAASCSRAALVEVLTGFAERVRSAESAASGSDS